MSSSIQNGQSMGVFTSVFPYVIPSLSASIAIVPVFYGFMVKSAQQMAEPIPKMVIKNVLKNGCQAAPTIGVIVGTQMSVQKIVEKILIKNNKSGDQPKLTSMLASSAIVGMISAPALAVFNGQTMGRTVTDSIRLLSVKQTTAIVSRETSFLFSLRISGPVSEAMKHSIGDNKVVGYSSAFVSGAIGSLIGHPADTALTLWQKEMKVTSLSQLMRGAPVKALTVGCFTTLYTFAQNAMQSKI